MANFVTKVMYGLSKLKNLINDLINTHDRNTYAHRYGFNHDINLYGNRVINVQSIELNKTSSAVPSSNGGFLDFHYHSVSTNGLNEDYTTRIVESYPGTIVQDTKNSNIIGNDENNKPVNKNTQTYHVLQGYHNLQYRLTNKGFDYKNLFFLTTDTVFQENKDYYTLHTLNNFYTDENGTLASGKLNANTTYYSRTGSGTTEDPYVYKKLNAGVDYIIGENAWSGTVDFLYKPVYVDTQSSVFNINEYYVLVNKYISTTDIYFQSNRDYYKLVNGNYIKAIAGTAAQVAAGTADYVNYNSIPSNTYYILYGQTYEPTKDNTFQSGVTYYKRTGGSGTTEDPYVYTPKAIVGTAIPPNTFYNTLSTIYTLVSSSSTFEANTLYAIKNNNNYLPVYTYEVNTNIPSGYYFTNTNGTLASGTFNANTTYYTRTGSGTTADPYVYTRAFAVGTSVPANTYYTSERPSNSNFYEVAESTLVVGSRDKRVAHNGIDVKTEKVYEYINGSQYKIDKNVVSYYFILSAKSVDDNDLYLTLNKYHNYQDENGKTYPYSTVETNGLLKVLRPSEPTITLQSTSYNNDNRSNMNLGTVNITDKFGRSVSAIGTKIENVVYNGISTNKQISVLTYFYNSIKKDYSFYVADPLDGSNHGCVIFSQPLYKVCCYSPTNEYEVANLKCINDHNANTSAHSAGFDHNVIISTKSDTQIKLQAKDYVFSTAISDATVTPRSNLENLGDVAITDKDNNAVILIGADARPYNDPNNKAGIQSYIYNSKLGHYSFMIHEPNDGTEGYVKFWPPLKDVLCITPVTTSNERQIANKKYVDDKFYNDIDLHSHRITGVADPVGNTDAATKDYVDNHTHKWLELGPVYGTGGYIDFHQPHQYEVGKAIPSGLYYIKSGNTYTLASGVFDENTDYYTHYYRYTSFTAGDQIPGGISTVDSNGVYHLASGNFVYGQTYYGRNSDNYYISLPKTDGTARIISTEYTYKPTSPASARQNTLQFFLPNLNSGDLNPYSSNNLAAFFRNDSSGLVFHMNDHRIVQLSTPQNSYDASTKKYVDDSLKGHNENLGTHPEGFSHNLYLKNNSNIHLYKTVSGGNLYTGGLLQLDTTDNTKNTIQLSLNGPNYNSADSSHTWDFASLKLSCGTNSSTSSALIHANTLSIDTNTFTTDASVTEDKSVATKEYVDYRYNYMATGFKCNLKSGSNDVNLNAEDDQVWEECQIGGSSYTDSPIYNKSHYAYILREIVNHWTDYEFDVSSYTRNNILKGWGKNEDGSYTYKSDKALVSYHFFAYVSPAVHRVCVQFKNNAYINFRADKSSTNIDSGWITILSRHRPPYINRYYVGSTFDDSWHKPWILEETVMLPTYVAFRIVCYSSSNSPIDGLLRYSADELKADKILYNADGQQSSTSTLKKRIDLVIPTDLYTVHISPNKYTKFDTNEHYFTRDVSGAFTEVSVTPGDSITANTYYIGEWKKATGKFSQDFFYHTRSGAGTTSSPYVYTPVTTSYTPYNDIPDDVEYYIFTGTRCNNTKFMSDTTYYMNYYHKVTIDGSNANDGITYYTRNSSGVYTKITTISSSMTAYIKYNFLYVKARKGTSTAVSNGDADYTDGNTITSNQFYLRYVNYGIGSSKPFISYLTLA